MAGDDLALERVFGSPTRPPPEAQGENEYLRQVLEHGLLRNGWIGEWPPISIDADEYVRRMLSRSALVERYAWAIPNDAALDAIAALSPIVDLGAGGGYWTLLLRARGARVAPFDTQPYPLLNGHVARAWVPVSRGGPARALKAGRERWTLLLCWPPFWTDFADRALERHRGAHVAYIGEGVGGCTATDRFHELLEERYELVDEVAIPHWYLTNDYLSIWRRR